MIKMMKTCPNCGAKTTSAIRLAKMIHREVKK